ncbi:50S ribosomal protein L11 methyltransferase [Streptomyces sp. NPDC058872]|uniref:50S ribosomal protein L11 methyltransferase n=1 Tax=Streptomyces sp. NPDC058872 TaxID=3346661 RepID=UPI0036927239
MNFEEQLTLASLRAGTAEVARMSAAVGEAVASFADASTGASRKVRDLARSLVPRWHFAMLNDVERNEALATAVERQVKPGDHVLDIGAGTGLLAMLAAKAGAAKVTSCEANPMMAEIATQVVAAHGLSDVITVIPRRSDELTIGRELERPVDVIVSEIVDCGLIGEGILPTMLHARTHLLAPGGRLMPPSARIHGALLQSSVIAGLNRVDHALGFDIGLINSLSTAGHFPVRLHTWPHTMLSDPTELVSFDFVDGPLADGSRKVSFSATADGTAHGIVAWFEMDLGAGVTLRNSPNNVSSHWMQALISFDEPLEVAAGDSVTVEVHWQDGLLSAV